VENPRLAIMKVMKRISLENVRDNKKRYDCNLTSKTGLCSRAITLESARIGKNCSIGNFTKIGDKCIIGDNMGKSEDYF
jgi:UDP-3-O-[3-hydroxymyristoyl] glucosamine N-acyltransferase